MTSWIFFFCTSLVVATIVIIPGYMLFRAAGFSRCASVTAAPIASIAYLTTAGVVFNNCNQAFSVFAALLALIPLWLMLYLSRYRKTEAKKANCDITISIEEVAWFLVLGVAAAAFFYLLPLDGPSSFQPDNDNATHLGIITTMAQTGNYSTLCTSVSAPGDSTPFVIDSSYYPAAFHIVAALALSVTNAPVAMVENATVFVIVAIVFPLGQLFFAKCIFGKWSAVFWLFPIVCMLNIGFPWRFISWGPLFPNLLAYALVPIAFASFVEVLKCGVRGSFPAKLFLLFLLSVMATAFSHPNGIFLLMLLCAVYVLAFCFRKLMNAGSSPTSAVVKFTFAVVAVVAAWLLLYSLPPLRGVVSFQWPPSRSLQDALFDIASLSCSVFAPQPFLAVIVALGFPQLFRKKYKEVRWLAAVYIVVAIQYVICASTDIPLKNVLCGFWYSDVNRISANFALVTMPIAALGAAGTFEVLRGIVRRARGLAAFPVEPCFKLRVCISVALVVVVVSSVALRGGELGFDRQLFYESVKYSVTSEKAYTSEEETFVEDALAITGDDLILNIPNDGSCFSHALDSANVYYRNVNLADGKGGNETEESKLIREHLCDYINRDDVKKAVEELDARYVLQLDCGKSKKWVNDYLPPYTPETWEGISSINNNTAGFALVLEKEDMRLYRIER